MPELLASVPHQPTSAHIELAEGKVRHCRAETALAALMRRSLNKEEEPRALVRELFVSSADIDPDERAKTLTIRIHRMASPVHDKAIAALLQELTDLQFCHPDTGHGIIYSLV